VEHSFVTWIFLMEGTEEGQALVEPALASKGDGSLDRLGAGAWSERTPICRPRCDWRDGGTGEQGENNNRIACQAIDIPLPLNPPFQVNRRTYGHRVQPAYLGTRAHTLDAQIQYSVFLSGLSPEV
jgi:hypothetical protein